LHTTTLLEMKALRVPLGQLNEGQGCTAGAHGFIGYASNTTMLFGSHRFELDYSQARRAGIGTRHLVLVLSVGHALTLQSLCLSLPA